MTPSDESHTVDGHEPVAPTNAHLLRLSHRQWPGACRPYSRPPTTPLTVDGQELVAPANNHLLCLSPSMARSLSPLRTPASSAGEPASAALTSYPPCSDGDPRSTPTPLYCTSRYLRSPAPRQTPKHLCWVEFDSLGEAKL